MLFCSRNVKPLVMSSTYKGNTRVVSGYAFHVAKAVDFPLPEKLDTVSHPVTAWKKGNASHLSCPSELAILCTGMNLKFLPTQNATQSWSIPNFLKLAIARTTTSVSTVLIIIFLCPNLAACAT